MKLSQTSRILSGHHSRRRISHDRHGTHRLLTAEGVEKNTGKVRKDALIRFTPKLSKSDCVLQDNDILFMSRGTQRYAVLLAEAPANMLAASSFFVIRVKDPFSLIPAFLAWYLNQEQVQGYFSRFSGQGVSMPVVRRKVLENLQIPLPPLSKQKGIRDIQQCLCEEQRLLRELAARRKQLVEAVCRKSIFLNS